MLVDITCLILLLEHTDSPPHAFKKRQGYGRCCCCVQFQFDFFRKRRRRNFQIGFVSCVRPLRSPSSLTCLSHLFACRVIGFPNPILDYGDLASDGLVKFDSTSIFGRDAFRLSNWKKNSTPPLCQASVTKTVRVTPIGLICFPSF